MNNKHPFVRLLWCALGAAVAISVALWIVELPEKSLLLASLGGSTIFLFGLTRAPAAQPRALFGGHLSGAFIGIACYQVFGDFISVYIAATVLTLCFMLITRCHLWSHRHRVSIGKIDLCGIVASIYDIYSSRNNFIVR